MEHTSPSAVDNPFLTLIGARRGEWREGYCEFHLDVTPQLLNRQGVLQGGVLATLLDVACGYAGLHAGEATPVHGHTVSLTTSFMSSGSRGHLAARGFLVQRTRTLFFARGEAWLDGKSLLATAQGCFKLAARPK